MCVWLQEEGGSPLGASSLWNHQDWRKTGWEVRKKMVFYSHSSVSLLANAAAPLSLSQHTPSPLTRLHAPALSLSLSALSMLSFPQPLLGRTLWVSLWWLRGTWQNTYQEQWGEIMAAALQPLPWTGNPVKDQRVSHSKHHSDVQTGSYMHITLKAR